LSDATGVAWIPNTAMVLAAGLGRRMRPITDTLPKPLVEVGGKALIDWGLDAARDAGVETAVVNVHYLADRLETHLADRRSPKVVVSDERAALLDSAGGIVRALRLLGGEPFLILNADTFWLDRRESNLRRLFGAWDDSRMDMLLLLADPVRATGHVGATDFVADADGRLSRAKGAPGGLIYAGAAVVHPRIFADAAPEPHSLNLYFDRAVSEARLFGLPLDGHWITVGTPDAIAPAEAAVARVRG
jgi:N-acetyl-alpha-D-muramate 1-phosphate uridylyltransferase